MKFKPLPSYEDILLWGGRARGIQFVISKELEEFRVSFKMEGEEEKPAHYLEMVFTSLSSAQEACQLTARQMVQ